MAINGLLSVWHAIFPLPPTPEEIVAQRSAQISDLSRQLDRRQRQRDRQEAKWQQQLDDHLDSSNEQKAKFVATLLARSQLHGQAALKLKLHIESMGEQVRQAHDRMQSERAFVDITKAVARFNHEIPNAKIALASVIYQRERAQSALKMDMMEETVAEEEEDEDELEANATQITGESNTATTILAAAKERSEKRLQEQLEVQAKLEQKRAARARREGRVAEAEAMEATATASHSTQQTQGEEHSTEAEQDKELARRLEALHVVETGHVKR